MATQSLINQRYVLQNQLGIGGMGAVYRAHDRLTNTAIALKQVTVSPEKLSLATTHATSDFRLALAHEFRVLASLRHPNIISVLDFGFDTQRQPYFTMDLLEEGETILKATQNQPLAVRYNYVLQMLQALAYLFRRKILHRDLKPANVLVKDHQVKVLDFGLAIAHGQESETAGTLAYIAPEILQGQSPSEASDLYAVGMIGYELITGHYPYTDKSLVQGVLFETPDFSEFDSSLEVIFRRLLSKHPNQRYSEISELISDYSEATGQTYNSTSLRESYLQAAQFVGRETEFKQLTHAFAEMMNGQGSAWLIGGESGVGKSRLLDELYIQALVGGAMVLRGQAVAERGLPYVPFREPLRMLCLHAELTELELGVLKGICPDIEVLLGRSIPTLPDLEPKAAQERLFSVISNLFKRQSRPLVLILEDMQWAGQRSIALLKHLLKENHTCLIAATYRDDEAPTLAADLSTMNKISLVRLSRDGIAELSESMLGKVGKEPAILNLLERETEGNVFFMVEVLRTLAEEAGHLERIGQMTLPTTVFASGIQMVVQRRLAQLPATTRPLLKLAAVTGRLLELPLLRTLGDGASVEEWLAICADASVLAVQDGTWRFAHDKLREGLLSDLLPEEKQALHSQIAQAIEVLHPHAMDKAAILAYHWHEAKQPILEFPYTITAGDSAYRLNSPQDAIVFYNRALELTQSITATSEQLAHLYAQRGRTFELSGQHRLAGENYADFRVYAERHQNAQLRLNALVMSVNLYILPNPEYNLDLGNQLIQEALILADELNDPAAKAKIYWMQMNSITFSGGNPDEALPYGLMAEAIARDHHLREQLAFILQDMGLPYLTKGNIETGLTKLREARPIWEEIGNLPLLADTLARIARCCYVRGDYQQALSANAESLQAARDCGNRWAMSNANFISGHSPYSDWGELDTAFGILSETIAWAEQAQNLVAMMCYAEMGWLYGAMGQIQTGFEYVKKAVEVSKRAKVMTAWASAMMARLYVRENKLDMAEEFLAQGRAGYRPSPFVPNRIYLALAAGEVAIARKENHVAVDSLNSLLDYLSYCGGLAYRPETLYLKSIALQQLDRNDEALTALQEAYQIAQKLMMRRMLWQILIGLYRIDGQEHWLVEAKTHIDFIAAHISGFSLRESFLGLPDVVFVLHGDY